MQNDKDTPSSTTSWMDVANEAFVLFATCGAVVAVQGPFSAMIYSWTKSGSYFLPSTATHNGFLAMARSFYVGGAPAVANSALRTANVTGAKKGGYGPDAHERAGMEEPQELSSEVSSVRNPARKNAMDSVRSVMFFSMSEVAISQFDTKEGLSKLGISPFKWTNPYNFFALSKAGAGLRFTTSMINFSSMCIFEEYLAGLMPFKSPTGNHVLSGATSGALAAVLSFPFSHVRDYALSKAQVDTAGRLFIPNALSLAAHGLKYVDEVGTVQATKQFFKIALASVPLRMLRSMVTFSTITGLGAYLRKDPVTRLFDNVTSNSQGKSGGFFTSISDKKGDTIDDVPSPTGCPWLS